ncbi:hypothetical protein [Metabacillus malikii]|uniref:PhoD-like phosphatase metallophosphatase domain-containing protein n=1 Tax=Metabacillus malikii TaxID=1504265 RepID=A0ABT9ZAW1_9BACI|nr:hypothetical protein [Metabacillus malikii]MDQ0228982.1 hypothetical protein [Metabacillus malikii]
MILPTILSGPIVRRVDPKAIYLWIALSKKCKVHAKLFTITKLKNEEKYDYKDLYAISNEEVIQLGKNLYIYLVKITPNQQKLFPTETLLGYNLYFTDKENLTSDLSDYQLLSSDNPASIVYGKLKYPSFYINEKEDTQFLYGSCRKIHGIGKDALARGDYVLHEQLLDTNHRPSALFLMGDQIYADDVADEVAPFLSHLGHFLIGKDENIIQLDSSLNKYENIINGTGYREDLINDKSKFTSAHTKNHLMRLGEYCTMYLLSWSPEIMSLAISYVLNDVSAEEKQSHFLTQFQETLPQVRRLFANIPTYMIFDDHDITDDWNISFEWKNRVENSLLGSHLIANGLTAYWAFQGWGNAPDSFPDSFKDTIQNYVTSFSIGTIQYETWKNTLFSFQQWHYVAPTRPHSLVLDTRTQRAYPSFHEKSSNINGHQGPVLMKDSAWENVYNLLITNGYEKNTPLIIVSATPVYGIAMVESFLTQYIMPLSKLHGSVRTTFDLEWWQFSHRGMQKFYEQLSDWDPSVCILLVGDAHMAYSLQTTFYSKRKKMRKKIYQFTSSPLHNQTFTGFTGLLLKVLISLYSKLKGLNKQGINIENALDEVIYYEFEDGSINENKNNLGLVTINEDDIIQAYLRNEPQHDHVQRFLK